MMAGKAMEVAYLIIGNSAGGIGAVEAIREVNRQSSLAIVSDEPYPAYSRPLISEYLAEHRPLEKMLYRPADFYERNAIQTYPGRKAMCLNPDAHTVELDSGEVISWRKLLLATGGEPILPPMSGREREGVFSFITLDDARTIDRYLEEGMSAVVIGGGLIGVSVTEALVRRGIRVTIVEMKERILNVMLDEEASAMEDEALKRFGVNIVTGHTVTGITGADRVSGVVLDDGRHIPCQMVIIAIGVRPRTEMVGGTGIEANRGIVVDHRMATSHPDIYACGDVAEAFDIAYGQCRLTPIWPNAYIGGRVAGFNMAGRATEYPGGISMNSLKYFGLNMVSAGVVNPPPEDAGYEILTARTGDIYRKVILKDGEAVGLVFAGNIEKSGIIIDLMKKKAKVDCFKENLIAADFSLISLPRELWQSDLQLPASAVVSAAPEEAEEVMAGE